MGGLYLLILALGFAGVLLLGLLVLGLSAPKSEARTVAFWICVGATGALITTVAAFFVWKSSYHGM